MTLNELREWHLECARVAEKSRAHEQNVVFSFAPGSYNATYYARAAESSSNLVSFHTEAAARIETTLSRLGHAPRTLAQLAEYLVSACYAQSQVVTISLEPLRPLAMGSHCMVIDFREARK